jgi:hypothetical protein
MKALKTRPIVVAMALCMSVLLPMEALAAAPPVIVYDINGAQDGVELVADTKVTKNTIKLGKASVKKAGNRYRATVKVTAKTTAESRPSVVGKYADNAEIQALVAERQVWSSGSCKIVKTITVKASTKAKARKLAIKKAYQSRAGLKKKARSAISNAERRLHKEILRYFQTVAPSPNLHVDPEPGTPLK